MTGKFRMPFVIGSALAMIAAFFLAPVAQAGTLTPVAYEGFAYTSGQSLVGQNGGTGWNAGWQSVSGSAQRMTVGPTGLTYPGLAVTGKSAGFGTPLSSERIEGNRRVLSQRPTSGVYYVRWLFNSGTTRTSGLGGPLLRFYDGGTQMGGVGVNDGAKNAFIYMAGPPVSTNINIVDGNTHLLITRFDFDNQRTDLWVDPNLATFDYSLPPTANASVNKALSFDQIHIYSLPDQYFDEITVFEWEPICESGVTPDGVRHECFLNGNSTWTVPLGVEEINYLVVGGGGGGGADNAGGGGAGGLIEASTPTTPGEVFTVTVGEGGAGGTGLDPNSTQGQDGDDSVLARGGTEIARGVGGGGGGAGQAGREAGKPGGSGGGGAGESASGTGGTGQTGQGQSGGAGVAGTGGGGGGGGATAAGTNASGSSGGKGGDGKSSSITGTAITFAGGGGGAGNLSTDSQGAGGSGGGGAGGNPAVFGTPNTGGGGGGGSYDGTAANGARGGRGIVVISYTLTSHNITFNANGGSGAPSPASGLTGETVTLSSTTPTRTGYTFTGWNTQVGGGGTSYSAGGSLTLSNADVTLYAQWTPVQYTVTYNLNGGSGTAPVSANVNYAATATVTSDVPTRSGYWFNGWNTAADGSGTAYAGGRTFTMLGDVTLYAQWVADEFDLAYNSNGGSGSPAAETRAAGSVANLSATTPSRTGYTFDNWDTNSAGTGTSYGAGASFAMPAQDTILYATWTPTPYTLSFDIDGGTGSVPANQTEQYLNSVTIPSTPVPTRTGYVFGGWGINSNGTGTVYAPGSTFLMPAEDLTLYAVWIGETVELHYDLNGGTGGPADSAQVPGSTVVIPLTVPTRSGLTFQSWNTADDGSGTSYSAGNSFTMPATNLTLYAQWGTTPTPTPTPESSAAQYTVSIDPNGGTCSTTSVSGPATSWVNLPGADSCTREGYTLRGFGTDPTGEGTVFAPGAPIQLTGDNRLFAIWTEVDSRSEALTCTADLYQVSGTGGGVIYRYDPTRNTMDLVPAGGGSSKAPGSNAIGYNPADDFIYGIAPNGVNRHLWKYGSNGVYEDLGPIINSATGAPVQNLSFISGDFIADDVLLTIQIPNRMLTVDVAPTRSEQSAQATLQTLPTGVWSAADIAFNADRTAGYGMSNNVLSIANLPGGDASAQITAIGQRSTFSTKTVLGVPARGTYGASYLDQENNAYFYNNEERRIYLISAAELAKSQPRAVPLGTEKAFVLGTDQTLQVPTDGASCPTAPIVTVKLEYRINGGRGDRPDDQSGFVDQLVTVAPAIGFEREGFTFAGWNSAADGSGASFPPGALYSLGQTGGVLFAQWKPEQPAPIVPPEKILDPIEDPAPPAGEAEDVIFTPIEDLPAPPEDPWDPSSLVLVDPDTRIETPVVQNQTGDWSVNNRIGTVTYTPDPAYSGPVSVTIQVQTVSGERYQATLQTTAPTCEVGQRVRATVYFDVLKSDLTKKSRQRLNRLIRKANREGIPTCSVVVGYVQPTVNRSNDISLSTSRATSVADYLDDRGIIRIIRTEGLGRADQQGAKARRATATIYIAPSPPDTPVDQ